MINRMLRKLKSCCGVLFAEGKHGIMKYELHICISSFIGELKSSIWSNFLKFNGNFCIESIYVIEIFKLIIKHSFHSNVGFYIPVFCTHSTSNFCVKK